MFKKTFLTAIVASTLMLSACQSTKPVTSAPAVVPTWTKSASADDGLFNPQLSDRTANLIFVRPQMNNLPDPNTSTNIILNDRFLVSLQDNHYSQAIVCAGDVALSAVATSLKINQPSQTAQINIAPGQTQVFAVITDSKGAPVFAELSEQDMAHALNGTFRQSHQISRFYVNENDCPPPVQEPVVAVPVPVPVPVPMPVTPPPAPAPEPEAEYYVETRPNLRLNILFDFDKSNIKPQYQGEIIKAAEFLAQYPDAQAIIEGHTDSRGAENYNQKLSERRADAVKRALIAKHGINPNRISSQGFGESRPVATNDTDEGRQQNRRVILVIPNGQ
ncbi:Major porin and structural outer membrane porin OprF [Moraxella catarrhalis]|uniref:OmpA family protein n=1 Tax=Moraxella catarrhalis TaxID=480 RepID=UPI0007E2F3D9|nr:OmpA family protein [Moraxella catarrhalis]OAV08115.1 Major porin and structural outer membrane porin OprF [Moraxella catarrhalis]